MKVVVLIMVVFCFANVSLHSQTDSIQKYKLGDDNVFTRGLFMSQGRYEVKVFSNLYTETVPIQETRSSYFSSFLQLTFGNKRNINYGMDLIYKSNISSDASVSSPFKVLNFNKKSEPSISQGKQFTTTYDHGLSHIGGRIRTKPFKEKRFTFQQALYAPLGSVDGGWIMNTDLFFEHLTANKKFMLFGDLGVWYNTNNPPFPYLKFFAGTLIAKRFGTYIMLNLPYEVGTGLKVFIHPKIELEFLYTWWLPLEFTVQDRKPRTFNLGLRFTNFNNFDFKK